VKKIRADFLHFLIYRLNRQGHLAFKSPLAMFQTAFHA
jgi:hypothetical protein